MSLLRSLFSLVLVGSLGCAVAHAPIDDDSEETGATDNAVSTKLPSSSLGQRIYFPNTTSPLPYGGGATVWPYPNAGESTVTSYWTFDAKGGTSFSVATSAYNDGEGLPDAKLSLTVYYLYRGSWRRADSATSKGNAKLTFHPKYDHQWLIAATGDVGSPDNNLEISLGCNSGVDAVGHSRCALKQEPGDVCGGLAASAFVCDQGLYCEYGATCGAGDVQGRCQPQSGCSTGKGSTPVCGCDGFTYASACEARSGGISVTHSGACGTCAWAAAPTDLKALSPVTWKTADGVVRYTFSIDGTFTAVYDLCATSGCKLAAQLKKGVAYVKGAAIVLQYEGSATANLTHQIGCAGEDRLDGTDFGRQVDATRVK